MNAPAQPAALGLRHVALRFQDLEGAERFFVELLGYRVEWRPDDDDVYLTRAGDNVALHRVSEAGGGSLLDHIGLFVPRAEDVDAWERHLDRLGARITTRPRTHRDGARSLYLAGPEGLTVQILHHPAALAAAPEQAPRRQV